jgi:hypothetical protein
MPTGIILKSASHEVSDEQREKNLQAVVEGAGYEVAPKEVEAQTEPKREEFKTEEEFEAAHVEWQDKEEKAAEEAEKAAAPVVKKPSRRERAVERATAAMKSENEKLKADLAKALEGKQPPKDVPRPKRLDFADDEKYEDALLAWGVENAKKETAVKDAQTAAQQRFERNVQNYTAQVEEAKEEYPDWDEVVNKDIFIGKEVQLAILENEENAAEVIYYLGRHPAYAKKLGEMSPLSAVMEVGRLSSRLKTGASSRDEANGEEPRKQKAKLPEPVKPVGSGTPSGSPTFAEIAARPNYPGKARDLRLAGAKQ